MNNNMVVFVMFRSKKCHFYHWDWILKAITEIVGISSEDPFLDSDSFLTFQAGCDACFWYCCVCLHSKKFKVFIVITEKLAWVGCTFPKKISQKSKLLFWCACQTFLCFVSIHFCNNNELVFCRVLLGIWQVCSFCYYSKLPFHPYQYPTS